MGLQYVFVVLVLMGCECLGEVTKQSKVQSGPRLQLQPSHAEVPAFARFAAQQQVTPNTVKAECSENSIVVDVQQDFFGIGQLIDPSEITLGGCPVTGWDVSTKVLRFESQLQDCGSTLMITDTLIYTFTLLYMPRAIGGTPIVRTNGAVVYIECHYLRKHSVSSNALMPAWIPYMAQMSAEEHMGFSLRIMTDDWQFERPSNVFFLGDFINIEASVDVTKNQAFRVFMDSCVATLVPDVMSAPKYDFVENYGCWAPDQFLPRNQDDKLRLHLDAFRFSQDSRSSVRTHIFSLTSCTRSNAFAQIKVIVMESDSGPIPQIYITCRLKANVASAPTDAQHKACSFAPSIKRWVGVDGNDWVRSCCDTNCESSAGRFAA
ncbi:ZP3 protein-like, partial [Scleropages formosus]